MNNKIDLSACVVGNGFINVYDEVCFLSEINHDNEFPYTLVYADGSKHNYRYDSLVILKLMKCYQFLKILVMI